MSSQKVKVVWLGYERSCKSEKLEIMKSASAIYQQALFDAALAIVVARSHEYEPASMGEDLDRYGVESAIEISELLIRSAAEKAQMGDFPEAFTVIEE